MEIANVTGKAGCRLTAFTLISLLLASNALGEGPTTGSFLHNGVTAHRGNSGEHPENTIPAFKSGIEIGADWIELDIFRSKDGKIVVIHDQTTERVGDKNLLVFAFAVFVFSSSEVDARDYEFDGKISRPVLEDGSNYDIGFIVDCTPVRCSPEVVDHARADEVWPVHLWQDYRVH